MNTLYEWSYELDTRHSMDRAKERAGLNAKKAKRLMDLARIRGIQSNDCRWSVDRRMLESKTDEDVIAMAYNGYCFIFDKQTMSCITLYALPKDFGKKKTYYQKYKSKSEKYTLEECMEEVKKFS